MKYKYLILTCFIASLSTCCLNSNSGSYVTKAGYDSLNVLAKKDTMNLYINRFYNGHDSIVIKKDTNSLLGDTIKLRYHISGETWQNADTLFTNFYFQNDTFHIYAAYEIRTRDSLSINFQVLNKTEETPVSSYANIDSLFMRFSANKYINANYDMW